MAREHLSNYKLHEGRECFKTLSDTTYRSSPSGSRMELSRRKSLFLRICFSMYKGL
jgi:hypothetical protein